MRLRPSTAILASMSLLAACGSSVQAATRNYTVTDFSKIHVEGPFDVKVHVGAPASARATAAPSALDRLSIEVRGDTLVIQPLPGGWGGWPGGQNGRVLIEVGARGLSDVGLAGSGDVAVDRIQGDRLRLSLAGSGDLSVGAVRVTQFTATMTGSGDLTVAGQTAQAHATLTGSGDFHGDKLAADDADISLVGSGGMALGAKHTAKVMLAGSGDVNITGPANCNVTRTGSGDVRCARPSAN